MKIYLIAFLSLSLLACSNQHSATPFEIQTDFQKLYSSQGVERAVTFQALYQTNFTDLQEFQDDPEVDSWEIAQTVKFLFGPLVHREIGGPQRGEKIVPHTEKAFLRRGVVVIPYTYSGTWLLNKNLTELVVPLPFSEEVAMSRSWKKCGDSEPSHQTRSFFWYFWDPTRPGCDHKQDVHYQNIQLQLGEETTQTVTSYPEYARMIRYVNGEKTLRMTFAFGYVTDPASPNPFQDWDSGMTELRQFDETVARQLKDLGFQQSDIRQSDYDMDSDLVIGHRYTGMKSGVKVTVSIVAAAGVDQMTLFAESYAGQNEGFFGWFGHSRVGSGFDADNFKDIVESSPDRYKISPDYQVIFWNGCNSYSYYTQAFFDMKAELNSDTDPSGTKNLDIISNGLPTYFNLNANNANIVFNALINWEKPTSYQSIVDSLEKHANNWMNTLILVNVLGDEDND